VAAQKTLPLEPLVPNSETIDAIKAARRGELVMVGGLENLLNKLKEDG
jgi:DNA-damage-inducible protein J